MLKCLEPLVPFSNSHKGSERVSDGLGSPIDAGTGFRFRYWWLVILSLLVHKLPFYLLAPSDGVILKKAALIVSLCVLLFALYKNARFLGARVMAAGTLLNVAAIIANGGLMPVTPEARILAEMPSVSRSVIGGVLPEGSGILLAAERTRLWFFTDIVPVRAIHGVFSIGDFLMYAGVLILIGQIIWATYARLPGRQEPVVGNAGTNVQI